MCKINLGDTVFDTVTGFQGIVVSKIEYLSGCIQYGVKAKVGEDGKATKVEYIDEGELKVIEPELSRKQAEEEATSPPGGIMPDAPKK